MARTTAVRSGVSGEDTAGRGVLGLGQGVTRDSSSGAISASQVGAVAELAEFPFVEDALTDALTYADQTVGPRERLSVADRLAEAVRRLGPDAPTSLAAPDATPTSTPRPTAPKPDCGLSRQPTAGGPRRQVPAEPVPAAAGGGISASR